MKRISRIFRRFFGGIAHIIDKCIITPITKLIILIGDLFKSNGKEFEKIFSRKQSLIVLSLILAFITFYAIDQKTITLIDNSAEVLYGQPVRAIYNEELYVVEGVPKTADVTLIGRKSDIYLAKQYPADEVILDLKDLKVGTHKVAVKYKQSVLSVDYKVDPSEITVVIYEKMSDSKELSYDILHKERLDTKLNIESVSLNRDTVIVKGAEYKLKQVASVKALIDISTLNNIKVGSTTLKEVPLVAYDEDGKVLDVEIVPENVEATIKISSPNKTVPIKIETIGELTNKSIQSLVSSNTNVTIYGDAKALETIEYVTAKIDVSGVTDNKKYTVPLEKPSGVRKMSVNEISINLFVDEVSTKEVENVKIKTINLGTGLKVQALSEKDSVTTVIVKGSSNVLNDISSASINAYIDLSDLTIGVHEVEVNVTGENTAATYTSRLKKVKVKIEKK